MVYVALRIQFVANREEYDWVSKSVAERKGARSLAAFSRDYTAIRFNCCSIVRTTSSSCGRGQGR